MLLAALCVQVVLLWAGLTTKTDLKSVKASKPVSLQIQPVLASEAVWVLSANLQTLAVHLCPHPLPSSFPGRALPTRVLFQGKVSLSWQPCWLVEKKKRNPQTVKEFREKDVKRASKSQVREHMEISVLPVNSIYSCRLPY